MEMKKGLRLAADMTEVFSVFPTKHLMDCVCRVFEDSERIVEAGGLIIQAQAELVSEAWNPGPIVERAIQIYERKRC